MSQQYGGSGRVRRTSDTREAGRREKSPHEGSVTHITNASGAVIESYRYDAFGVPTITNTSGITTNNRFMFTGREYISQFGIYEYRARTYHPGLGRFLSEDPKGFDSGDYNLFRYCKNEPEDLTDPMGLMPWSTRGGSPAGDIGNGTTVYEDCAFRNESACQTSPSQASSSSSSSSNSSYTMAFAGLAARLDAAQHDAAAREAKAEARRNEPPKVFTGEASEYNTPRAKLASGGSFDGSKMAAAMTSEKANLGQRVTVTYNYQDKDGKTQSKTIVVVVNDRGPFAMHANGQPIYPLRPHSTRVIDLTPTAFKALVGTERPGHVPVTVRVPNE